MGVYQNSQILSDLYFCHLRLTDVGSLLNKLNCRYCTGDNLYGFLMDFLENKRIFAKVVRDFLGVKCPSFLRINPFVLKNLVHYFQ